ncbi:MAG: alpha/beta hydrolase [Dehalococcoidia bacterium]|nr:alpha/beta hydrolase [Dehalococcoidia bacterium]
MTLGLLALHAFPLDSDMWDGQVGALSVPVVPVDLPGFGQAAMYEPDGWMDEAADHADAALGGTGIDRVVVCGLSMGGYVALAYVRRHRDKVAGLILANTRADADDDAAKERRRGLAERLRSEGNFLADSPPPLLSDNAPSEVRERVSEIIRRQDPEAIARASLAMAARADSTGDLAGIDVPTLVITSSADTLISPDLSKQMADAVPGARLETIEGAGHLSNMEAPEQFNEIVESFLKGIES